MIEMLMNMTVVTLEFLIKFYNDGAIDFLLFREHVGVKIAFLKENIDKISVETEKGKVESIIQQCEHVLIGENENNFLYGN